MRVDVSGVPDEAVWVGQKVSLNVRVLLVERPEGLIQFDVPDGEGGVFLRLQESPFFGTESVDGISFTTWNHTFLFYPHRAGPSRIPPMTVRVTLGKEEPRELEAATAAIDLTAKLPEGAESLATLVATPTLQVAETWSPGPPEEAKVGDAFTRTIKLTAPDVLAMGFPVPTFTASDTLRVYPKAPAARDTISRGEITGHRTESVVYICQAEGEAVIPTLVYPWLNLESETLEKIELPARTFTVVPNPAMPPPGSEEGPSTLPVWRALMLTIPILAGFGFLGWCLGPRLGRRIEGWWDERQASEPAVFRRLVLALEEGNLKHYHAESRCWLKTLPGRRPDTLPLFAEECGTAELSGLLGEWLAAEYAGKPANQPDHKDLAAALKRARRNVLAHRRGRGALPPLNLP